MERYIGIDAFAMVESLRTGSFQNRVYKKVGEFTIPGIGKLVKQKRKASMGRNPATGEAIKIPAKTVVKMRLSKTCKDEIVPPKKQ